MRIYNNKTKKNIYFFLISPIVRWRMDGRVVKFSRCWWGLVVRNRIENPNQHLENLITLGWRWTVDCVTFWPELQCSVSLRLITLRL